MRFIEVGKEGDGKDTVHQETGWVGKRRAGDRKATEIGWVRREVDGKEMGSYIITHCTDSSCAHKIRAHAVGDFNK